jgi:hypothetical protein
MYRVKNQRRDAKQTHLNRVRRRLTAARNPALKAGFLFVAQGLRQPALRRFGAT